MTRQVGQVISEGRVESGFLSDDLLISSFVHVSELHGKLVLEQIIF